MQIDWAMLCNACEVQNGVGYILGAGIDVVVPQPFPPSPPAPPPPPGAIGVAQFVFAMRVLLARNEFGRQHSMVVKIVDTDGAEVGKFDGHFEAQGQIMPGAPAGILFGNIVALPIPLLLQKLGQYSIDVSINGAHLKSVPFSAVQRVP